MARPAGLEPAPFCLEGRRSIQLSYGRFPNSTKICGSRSRHFTSLPIYRRTFTSSTSGVPLRLSLPPCYSETSKTHPQTDWCVQTRQRTMDADKLRVARDKLTRVFRYLEALNQHRNPAKRQIHEQPWSFWLRNLPDHPSIQRGGVKSNSLKTNNRNSQGTEDGGANYILKVQRPRLTRGPEPPEEIAAWLEDGWDDPSNALTLKQTLEESENRAEPKTVKFTDDPSRATILERWQLLRNEWLKTEEPARAAMKLFESFYALYGRVDREAERVEFVLGDGILSWRRAEGGIYHPILLQRLQLQFDASVPEFTLSEADHPVELYSALFQSMNDVDGRGIGRCREELEKEGFHPLNNDSTSGFLKRLVVQLSSRGEFLEDCAPNAEVNDPCIRRDPVLFLRARTLGFAAAIEGILADLRTREDLPWSLLNIVGEESPIPG